jgi:hypothetical protein
MCGDVRSVSSDAGRDIGRRAASWGEKRTNEAVDQHS